MGTPGQPPPVPLNLIGDFGGGGMLLGFGIVSALYERDRSGAGQVLDVSMLDGVLLLSASLFQLRAEGLMHTERGQSFLDGGAPWYRAYRAEDGRYLTVGALEPQFYRLLMQTLDIDEAQYPQWDKDRWPALSAVWSGCSPVGHRRTGSSCWVTPTSASPRCWTSTTSNRTRTTPRAAPSPQRSACGNRRPRRASAEPPAGFRAVRHTGRAHSADPRGDQGEQPWRSLGRETDKFRRGGRRGHPHRRAVSSSANVRHEVRPSRPTTTSAGACWRPWVSRRATSGSGWRSYSPARGCSSTPRPSSPTRSRKLHGARVGVLVTAGFKDEFRFAAVRGCEWSTTTCRPTSPTCSPAATRSRSPNASTIRARVLVAMDESQVVEAARRLVEDRG